jgi:hypothetical protein
MKNMRIFHLVFLLVFMLAISLQPANGQTTGPGSAPAESTPEPENPSTAAGSAEITPLTISLAGGPDFDSGWVPVPQGQTLTLKHNLGGPSTDNYWVDLDFWNAVSGINQSYYGGADISDTNGHVGAYWKNLTTTSISITRRANDPFAEKVRVRIWTDPAPMGYKNWNYMDRGSYINLTSIVVDPDNYLVDLRFQDTTPGGYGINQRFYGGKDCLSTATDCQANAREGATWFGLGTNKASVFRMNEDTSCNDLYQQFLTKTWVLPKPTYVSAWQEITPGGDFTFTHSIGGNAEDYLVDLDFQSDDPVVGINQIYYGGTRLSTHASRSFPALGSPGDMVGAYWNQLTPSTINVHRNLQDQNADWVRVRIWDFWKPPQANYDSGWFNISPGTMTKYFDLSAAGGSVSNYLVDFQFKNSTGVIHQHYFGMNELSNASDNRVGAYWSHLTNNSIDIVRANEDTSVTQGRVRIWVMPKADVDAVQSVGAGNYWEYGHNLGGLVSNYLIDLEFTSPAYGVNQAAYGGYTTGSKSPLGADKQVGAYWNKLTNSSITIYRLQDDVFASTQVRLRMWRVAKPNYHSGFTSPKVLSHNLYQNPEDYFVSIMFNEGTSVGYNQEYYGGADLLDNSKVGAFWSNLTPMQITVAKEINDGFAGEVDVRIWVTNYYYYWPILKK